MYFGYLPYDSNKEVFMVQLFSLTKFNNHPGFVTDPEDGARKSGIKKIPVGLRVSCPVAPVRKAVALLWCDWRGGGIF